MLLAIRAERINDNDAITAGDPDLEATINGDKQATERLVRRLLPRVRNLVRYVVRGDRDVDDFAQEALLIVLRSLPGFRGEGNFERWVDRIVSRAAIKMVRKRRRDPAEPAAETFRVGQLPTSTGDAERFADRRELAAALDRLSDIQRQVLVLHYMLGMTVPEVATELDVAQETVRSRLRLARAALRKEWHD